MWDPFYTCCRTLSDTFHVLFSAFHNLKTYLSEKGGGDSVQTFAEKIIMNPSLSAGGPPAGGTIFLANGPICTGVTTMNAIAGSDPGNALGQGTV